MLCWSCGKEVADNAARCSHCEAEVQSAPNAQEMDLARVFLDNLDPDMRDELLRVFESSESGEEFVNRILIGDCPNCGSDKTGDCENDPDVEDISIGRCFECGHLWCTVCDSPVTAGKCCALCLEMDDEFEEFDDERLDRYHLLAAEIFGYSFDNYRDHLGIGNVRFEKLMPETARILEQAVQENWSPRRVAKALRRDGSTDEEQAQRLLTACKNALLIVDAGNAAESFRRGVRMTVELAIKRGLGDKDSVEALITQICYRAADLAVLLELEGETLSRYCEELRRQPDRDPNGA